MQKYSQNGMGTVYLVGAGPGAPDLLTLRAAHILASADAVVFDHLVDTPILALLPKHAQRHYAGKQKGMHSMPQSEMNALLIELAKKYATVVRLKGGDPFIFGRGGEEVQALVQAGIPFEVVPGVTAASAAAAALGVSLTHRDYAQRLQMVTGHLQEGTPELDWASLAANQQTVVVYMGLTSAATIAKELMKHGAPGARKVAIIQAASTPNQRTLISTLASLDIDLAAQPMQSPSLLIIGDVLNMLI